MTIRSAIPVLRVGDYPTARRFWTGPMGFACMQEGGTPPRFGTFSRDGATVFVDAWQGADPMPAPGWRAYFHVDDAESLAAELNAGGLTVEGPADTDYNMREIVVTDPSGNRLCFGEDIT